jgi:hypothetical protein
MSVPRIGKLSPLDSPELRNSVDQIPFFNLRRSMNRDLRRVGGANAQRSSLSQPSKLVVGMDAASSREDRRNWFGSELFLVFRDANARTLFAFLALFGHPHALS